MRFPRKRTEAAHGTDLGVCACSQLLSKAQRVHHSGVFGVLIRSGVVYRLRRGRRGGQCGLARPLFFWCGGGGALVLRSCCSAVTSATSAVSLRMKGVGSLNLPRSSSETSYYRQRCARWSRLQVRCAVCVRRCRACRTTRPARQMLLQRKTSGVTHLQPQEKRRRQRDTSSTTDNSVRHFCSCCSETV